MPLCVIPRTGTARLCVPSQRRRRRIALGTCIEYCLGHTPSSTSRSAADVLRDGGRLVFGALLQHVQPSEEQAAQEATKVASSCMVETFRCELVLARACEGMVSRAGEGRPAAQGSTDYSCDREAGRERRTLVVLEKRRGANSVTLR